MWGFFCGDEESGAVVSLTFKGHVTQPACMNGKILIGATASLITVAARTVERCRHT